MKKWIIKSQWLAADEHRQVSFADATKSDWSKVLNDACGEIPSPRFWFDDCQESAMNSGRVPNLFDGLSSAERQALEDWYSKGILASLESPEADHVQPYKDEDPEVIAAVEPRDASRASSVSPSPPLDGPKSAERLLCFLVSPSHMESVVGDLAEKYDRQVRRHGGRFASILYAWWVFGYAYHALLNRIREWVELAQKLRSG